MPTQDEKNLALNRFMGWEPNQKCDGCTDRRWFGQGFNGEYYQWHNSHDIPPFNFCADTPEAYWRTKLLKDEYVRRSGKWMFRQDSFVSSEGVLVHQAFLVGCPLKRIHFYEIESHAILDAIYEAIK